MLIHQCVCVCAVPRLEQEIFQAFLGWDDSQNHPVPPRCTVVRTLFVLAHCGTSPWLPWLLGPAGSGNIAVVFRWPPFIDDSPNQKWWFHVISYSYDICWITRRIQKLSLGFVAGPVWDREILRQAWYGFPRFLCENRSCYQPVEKVGQNPTR